VYRAIGGSTAGLYYNYNTESSMWMLQCDCTGDKLGTNQAEATIPAQSGAVPLEDATWNCLIDGGWQQRPTTITPLSLVETSAVRDEIARVVTEKDRQIAARVQGWNQASAERLAHREAMHAANITAMREAERQHFDDAALLQTELHQTAAQLHEAQTQLARAQEQVEQQATPAEEGIPPAADQADRVHPQREQQAPAPAPVPAEMRHEQQQQPEEAEPSDAFSVGEIIQCPGCQGGCLAPQRAKALRCANCRMIIRPGDVDRSLVRRTQD
jgi:hypothetical protein